MGNKPEEDIQVENETVEPYRGIMIFRTLQRGEIVGAGGAKSVKSFPPQTFYAVLTQDQLPKSSDSDGILVGNDLESVRAQIDGSIPGTGLVGGVHPSRAKDKAKAA